MKKNLPLLFLLLAGVLSPVARADEGMWLPALISQRIGDMQAKGFRLTAEDIYSVNQASLKDAVVLFGGGCTGELVSADGLLLTNHHCGYSYIQKHSSIAHDYLKDGFWAMDRSGELPNKGLTVSFLDRMEDVTGIVLQGYDERTMDEGQRDSVVHANGARLIRQAVADGKGLRASVEALFYGNAYYLFVYRVFSDVRLVAAPPSSIGKFGGDTDNWMWPRHTGDFSIFRIYADKDNNPAEYAPDNVPYHPKKFFRISRAGVQEGDFTMISGCPGSTKEYVTSDEVRYVSETSDPRKIALRTLRLDIQKKYMDADPAVRIQYASKNASVANAWKKWQGEARGIARMKTIAAKEAYERRFRQWSEGTAYEGVLDTLARWYAIRNPYYLASEFYVETARSVELLQLAAAVENALSTAKEPSAAVGELADAFFKDWYLPIDRESFDALMEAFAREVPAELQPAFFKEILKEKGSVAAIGDELFGQSLFTDAARVKALTKADLEQVRQDPACRFQRAFYAWYKEELMPVVGAANERIRLAYRRYMRGQMAFEPDKVFYPDANLTLRVAYGHVKGYSPADGAYYPPVSTVKGIIEKDNPDIYDYDIPQRLRDLYARGGIDTQPVCFLATNHTSGGNSGSPVLNADGDLVGINFDRVWEGTMSDIAYDPAFCRNISLDIRYLLFVVEHIGGAGWLLDEMQFTDPPEKKGKRRAI